MRTVVNIVKWTTISLLLLFCILFLLLKTPAVQSWLGKQVAKTLSKELGTRIEVDGVSFSLLDRFALNGLLVMDRQQDTILYAEQLQLSLSDWFFTKDSIELTQVELSNALIRIQRSDSTWRHQFVLDYFTKNQANDKVSKKKSVPVHLHHLSVASTRFEQLDGWKGFSMRAKVEQADLLADQLSTTEKDVKINLLSVKKPEVSLYRYAGNKPSSAASTTADKFFGTGDSLNLTNAFNLQLGSVDITDGTLIVRQEGRELTPGVFDAVQPEISSLNLSLQQTAWKGDTLRSQLSLSANERSGFAIRKLKSGVQWTSGIISLDSFFLQTNNSSIEQRASFRYRSLTDLFALSKEVQFESQLSRGNISSKDIAYFFPQAASFNKNIQLQARLSGNLAELNIRELVLKAGNESSLEGDLTFKNLDDIKNRAIFLQAKRLSTSYEDLIFFIPSLAQKTDPDLSKLRYIRFQGSISAQQENWTTKGNWQTGLGGIETALRIRMFPHRSPEYQGSLQLSGFDAGALIGQKSVGKIDFKGSIQGTGRSLLETEASYKGTFASLRFNEYTFHDIDVDGSLKDQMLRFKTSVRDEHLITGPLEATLQIGDQQNKFTFTGSVEKASLKELQLSEKDLQVSGNIAASVAYSSPNDLNGFIAIRDAAISLQDEILPLDSLLIQVNTTPEKKSILIASNEFSASLQGQFQLNELNAIGEHFLARYYPSQIEPSSPLKPDTQILFSLQTSMASPFLSSVAPEWSGLNYSTVEASWNPALDSFSLKATIPELRYRQYRAEKIDINSSSLDNTLRVEGNAGQFIINDTVSLPPARLLFLAKNDSSQIQLRSGSGSGVEKLNLNALVTTYTDGFVLHWEPSDFTVNGKLWTLGEESELVLRKNRPVSGSLSLSEGDQLLRLRTLPKVGDQKDKISVSLSNINLNDLGPFLLPDNRLEGVVTGNLLIEDPLEDLHISSDQIYTRLLRLDNDSIGEVRTQLRYEQKSGTFTANGSTLNEQEKLSFDIKLFGQDSLSTNNKITLNTQQYPVKLLERFLGDLFSDITGYLTGNIEVGGDLNRPSVTGKGLLTKAGLRVNYTQCYYRIDEKEIELTPSRIELDGIVLRDTVTNNPIYVSGGIDHASFTDLFYDLDISTRKPGTRGEQNNRPVQLLNTTRFDNNLFYGNVKGTALLQLRGPQTDMVMTLNATASDKDSSYVTLPPGTGRESGSADFLIERKFGKEMAAEGYSKQSTNILFDLELTANPLLQVKVVLDELSGDEIKGKGSGTLNIRTGTTEPLSLRGRLGIEEGNYLFTFQSFFKKPFEIKKGANNYIEWNGDPYDANIKFEAVYKSERVSFAPLASALNLTADISNARSDVFVMARLTDKLFKPTIAFSLDFPANSIANSNPELTLLLRQLQSNSNELNRQVTYLIVFNSFAPNELGGALSGAGVNVSTISGILLSVLSDQINKLFSNLLRSDKYRINLNTSLYNRNVLASSSTALNLGSNVNFSIGRSFFDNRFIISTGLGMDAPLGQGTQSSVQQSILLLPDVTMEWLINPTGTIRASFFYRTNADFLTASTSASVVRSRRAGASLSYKREYDKLSDIFGGKKTKKNNK